MNENMKEHLKKSLSHNVRLDGRNLLDFRPIEVEVGISKTAEGSARVRIGETEVITGVKLELGKPYPDTPNEGTIMIGAELLPMSSPDFEPGPPGIKATELARVTDRCIRESKALDTKRLCIKAGEKVWMVVADICSINDDGNLQDASTLATILALKDATFPTITEAGTVDYKTKTAEKLPLVSMPTSTTVIKIGSNFIVDPSIVEESCLDARLTVGLTEDGRICALQKGGEAPLTQEDIGRMIDIATEKSEELRKFI